ncbi:MAG: hypothetical protein QOH25_324 [Acidobacteriota bacterium]|jgi:hypothetical protein|nr:hypothetical protein [Acidobacteriota bacterium]
MYPSGLWYNELGSQMELNVSGNNVWGWYYSAVGVAAFTYPLAGQINPQPYPFSQVLGWAVAWTNAYQKAHSVTTWSGQYQTIDNQEEIIAFWLLTNETQEAQDWEATNVGQDVFTRTMPTEEEIERNRKRRAKSHPSEGNS